MKWYNASEAPFKVWGLPFFETDRVYRRFRLEPPAPLPPSVEGLCNHPAGGQIRFRARFRTLWVRVTLGHEPGMSNMTPMGQCGIDCYMNRAGEEPIYAATAKPKVRESFYEVPLLEMDEADEYFITLNLPLYCPLKELEIGLDDDAAVSEGEDYPAGKIVVYGGSIDQGGCATRPGMAYTNILSRWMGREFVNLGFSGNGKAEAEVALAVRQIPDIALFVINTAGNCPDAAWLAERMPRFLELFREVWPDVPILVWQLADFARLRFRPKEAAVFEAKREVERQTVRSRIAAGDRHISIACMEYGDSFMGHDLSREVTVDGAHPSDLGFVYTAEKLCPLLTNLLNPQDK